MSTVAHHPEKAKPGQLTAMISSTALDLEKHRPAVEAACIGAGVFPIWMKHLPARDTDGVKVSLEMVDQADLYIGIYAWRYGWVPKGGGKSITELEFDHAVERKAANKLHELLIFTAHDDHPFTKKDIETDATAQANLAAFKTRACEGRGKKDFSSAEELQRLVSEALHEFKARQQHSDIRHSELVILHSSIPHNLPSLQPFFGREDELKKIADALDPDSRTWGALIDGPGGMGKTSLAVRAAYAASPDVFKKIIFVSLKTRELDDDGLRDLSGFLISGLVELLGELARELGRDDLLKLPEDQRPRLLLDALRGTQSLLVLDNLESLLKPERDTLFTFVKKLPTGCKAILTSRGRIGSGAEELILEALSEDAALATLAELATHNPLLAQTSEAERLVLYRETAGKPLLLRWTAGQLGRGHCLTFTDALHFIRSCPEGNDPLEFIFGDLVIELSDVEIRALCALTYFSIPAKVEHIAAIAGLDIADAKECRSCVPSIRKDEMPRQKGERGACSKNDCDLVRISQSLATLANRSLVVPDQEERAFTLVPMVADFLRLRKPEIVAQTGDKIEKSAYASILENGSRQTERFPMLQAEWPTISASLSLFLGGENERLQKICIALDLFLDFTGRWDELLSLCDRAELKALVARDFYHAGWRAYSAGIGRLRFQQGEEALVCASRAKIHWQIIQVGPRESSLLLDLLGNGYKLKKQYAEAIASFRESVCLRRSVSSQSVGLSMAINDLADAEACLGDHVSALTNYGEALNMAKAINYAEGTAAYTGNLARLALSLDDSDGAVTHASEALALSEKLGRIELIASSCECLAQALLRQGRAAEALPHARKAVKIFTRLGSPDLAAAQAILTECETAV